MKGLNEWITSAISLRNLRGQTFILKTVPQRRAEPASGTVYRLVKHDPARAEDFKSFFEENPKGAKKKKTVKIYGLSVHRDLSDSERLKKRSKKFKNRHIAKGSLNPTLGMIQHTPSIEESHHSWWIPFGTEPWLVFNVIG